LILNVLQHSSKLNFSSILTFYFIMPEYFPLLNLFIKIFNLFLFIISSSFKYFTWNQNFFVFCRLSKTSNQFSGISQLLTLKSKSFLGLLYPCVHFTIINHLKVIEYKASIWLWSDWINIFTLFKYFKSGREGKNKCLKDFRTLKMSFNFYLNFFCGSCRYNYIFIKFKLKRG